MEVGTITADNTNKCLTFTIVGQPNNNLAVASRSHIVFGSTLIAFVLKKTSSTQANYTANNFDRNNLIRVITNDGTQGQRGSAILTIDLNKQTWSLGGTGYTDAELLKNAMESYIANYK
jgi:hypothetical protein